MLKKVLKYFFTFQPKVTQGLPPNKGVPAFSVGTPRPGLSLTLWILVVLLLVGYPANTIWRLMPFYADAWLAIDIVLIGMSGLVGLQLLNRYPTALRNTKLFFVLNIFVAATQYVVYEGLDGKWDNIDTLSSALLRMGVLWLFVNFSKRGRVLFPDAPIPRRKPWLMLSRYFSGNFIGQIFTYSTIVLLIVAVMNTPASSPSDGSSKRDSAQEKAADAWLEDHQDNLKQLMRSPTGMKPTLSAVVPGASILDAKTVYEQKSPAVVYISTNNGFGAGFFLTTDGIIATSKHVLNGASDAVVMMKSGELHAIDTILSCDTSKDYCLFKIDVTGAPFLTLGDSLAVTVGDPVVVIGHPYGYTYSLSNGLVSQIQEYDKAGTLFQFTAPASPGNSGGPVFNTYGQVIGITNSLIASNDAQNLNFATSVSSLKSAIQQ